MPPRSVVPPTRIEIRTLSNAFSLEDPPSRPGFQAPEFPTLCETCNVTRLGGAYDPTLSQFCNSVAAWVRGRFELGLSLGSTMPATTRLNRVLRAVVGHLLAAEPRPSPWEPLHDGEMTIAMREYFLAPEAGPPPELSVHCWLYPCDEQIILRGFVRKDWFSKNNLDPILGDLIKFFPVGFWLTWQNHDVQVHLPDLARLASSDLDEEIDVTLDLTRVPPLGWPETPGDDAILLVDQTRGLSSRPAGRRGRTRW